jgi:HK97 family phage major capsid protein
MKNKIKRLLAQKQDKRSALLTRSQSSEDVKELRSINSEIEAINEEIATLQKMLDELSETLDDEAKSKDDEDDKRSADPEFKGAESRAALPGMPGQAQVVGTFGAGTDMRTAQDIFKQIETRAADLIGGKAVVFTTEELQALEQRATALAGGTLLVPKHQSSTLNPTFNEINGVINQVNSIGLPGGDTYSKGYEISIGEGDYTTETGNYTESDPVFGYVDIVKAKITVYSEITDEVKKLPAVDYAAYVSASVLNMLRKKISKEIFVGTGGANKLKGILTSVTPLTNDIDLAAIDANSLTKIVFGYGGDEDVEGGCTLYINKLTLQQFAEIRGADSKPVYRINMNGNSGTIGYADGSLTVPYTLASVLPSFTATVEDQFFGVYGNPALYELAMFSGVEILESRDFKFRSGQIAYRGAVWAGGSPAAYKGFARLKKNAIA